MAMDRDRAKNRVLWAESVPRTTNTDTWEPRTESETVRRGLGAGFLQLGPLSLAAHFLIVMSLLVLTFLSTAQTSALANSDARTSLQAQRRDSDGSTLPTSQDRQRRYHWLFREKQPEEPAKEGENESLLEKLDSEIKQARKLYLAGDTDNAILKYRSAIDHFESLLDEIPPGSPILREMEHRFQVFDETATKILGPLQSEVPAEATSRVFHLFEKRRICRRNLTLKKAGPLDFFDVPPSLLKRESEILLSLMELRTNLSVSQDNQPKGNDLRSQLAEVRRLIQKTSARYSGFRSGLSQPLDEVRKHLIGTHEAVLDFNLLPDRVVIGLVTTEKAEYHQFPLVRSEIDKSIFQLQDRLREFSSGGQSTFMGHAWKEPCRRVFRSLLGKLPALPREKTTIFVIPDRSLWYLPLASLLDSEDRPYGQDRIVSLVPSMDMLNFIRSSESTKKFAASGSSLLLFESIPWIPEEQVKEKFSGTSGKKKDLPKASEEEKLEQLILSNPVYPKPSDIVVKVQKMFTKFEVLVGPAATIDRFLEYRERQNDFTVLAVPLSMWDSVSPDRQPVFFFSPDKNGTRRFEVGRLFGFPFATKIIVTPISWFNVTDRENPLGEGPLLLASAMIYSGFYMGMINYSDVNWGSEEPFLLTLLKKGAEKVAPGKVLSEFPRELPAGLDSSFGGKPPSWAGWILMGDPGR